MQKGAGDGGWALDFHTQFDPPDAIRLCTMIEAADLNPYFIEDLIRSENIDAYKTIRQRTRVPIAMGEQLGYKWDIAPLIEGQLIDYVRTALPNVGGISEYMKIVALAETPLCRHDSAFHQPDRRSGAGALPHRLLDPGPDGDPGQWRPHLALSAEGL